MDPDNVLGRFQKLLFVFLDSSEGRFYYRLWKIIPLEIFMMDVM